MRNSKTWVSLWIILVVGLHALPVLRNEGQAQTTWPWLKWAMYKDSWPAGPISAERRRLSARTESGAVVAVTEDSVGLSRFAINRNYVRPWMLGDTGAAARLVARLNRRRSDSIVELDLSIDRYTITDSLQIDRQSLSYTTHSTGSR